MAQKLDFATGFDTAMREAVMPTTGFSAEAVENFDVFIDEGQFTVDRKVISSKDFFWMHPLYRVTRTDIMGVWGTNADGSKVCLTKPRFEHGIYLRKASQMGATVYSMLFMIWLCIDLQRPLGIACFWPTEKDLIDFVQQRFDPLLKSSPKMEAYLGPDKIDNTRGKQIGRSNLFLRYVKGQATLDSIPVDILIFDEVRLYEDAQGIAERADYRVAQSDVKLRVYMSTVGSPGDFMEKGWDRSNRLKYYSDCPSGCVTVPNVKGDRAGRIVPADERAFIAFGDDDLPLVLDGVVLSDYDPTVFVQRATTHRVVEGGVELVEDDTHYVCPCCRARIHDPGVGSYRESNPGPARPFSLEFAAVLSRRTPPLTVIEKFESAKDRKEYFNNVLAKPYRDPEGTIIKPAHIEAARSDASLAWHWTAPAGMETFLGADFRTEEIHVCVLGRDSEGKGQVLHVEVIQGKGDDGEDPFVRLERLLFRYAVTCAVIDYRPFTTTTLGIAQRNDHRVFLSDYRAGDMIRRKSENGEGVRQVSEDARERNVVLIDRVKSLKFSLYSFALGQWKMPSEELEQPGFVDRKRRVHAGYDVAREFTEHLQNLSLVRRDAKTKNASGEAAQAAAEFTEEFVNVEFDPHFCHAFNYAVMASEMTPGGGQLIRPGPPRPELGMPVVASVRHKRCGTCMHFRAVAPGGDASGGDATGRDGMCDAICATVRENDPPCRYNLYRPLNESVRNRAQDSLIPANRIGNLLSAALRNPLRGW